ncbi:MAG: flippase [Candidatus Omnitrophica bacterium]|nr:flippase [Candidatus Omnitrophota bacterium]
MQIAKIILKNSSFVLAGNILGRVFIFLSAFLLARYLGKVNYGIFSFAMSFLVFFAIIEDLWLKPIIVRDVAKDEQRAGVFLGNAVILRLIISFIAACSISIFLWSSKCLLDTSVLVYLTLINFILFSFTNSYEVVFRVKLAMVYYVTINFIVDILLVFSILCGIFLKSGVIFFVISIIITNLTRLLLLRYFSRRFIKLSFISVFAICKDILKESWFLLPVAAFVAISQRADQIMLFKMKGPGSVGSYMAAVRLVECFNMIPLALSVSLLPLLSRYFHTSKEIFTKIYQLSYKYLILIIMFIASFFTIFSKPIIQLFYGGQFSASSYVLVVLIWVELFIFIGIVNYMIIVAINQLWVAVFCTAIAATLNIFLNFILIPKYDFFGSGVASFISYAVSALLVCFIPSVRVYFVNIFRLMVKPLIGALVTGTIVYLSGLPFSASLLIAPLLYLVILYMIHGFDSDELKTLKNILFKANI